MAHLNSAKVGKNRALGFFLHFENGRIGSELSLRTHIDGLLIEIVSHVFVHTILVLEDLLRLVNYLNIAESRVTTIQLAMTSRVTHTIRRGGVRPTSSLDRIDYFSDISRLLEVFKIFGAH